MKIVVAFKWAANPQEATVAADGTVDVGRATLGISEYDPQAFEVGRRLADTTGAELIGLTVGGPAATSSMARKAALSRGLDSLVTVTDPSLDDAAATRTGAVLAAAVAQIGDVDLVLTGDASVDLGVQLVPSVMACSAGPRSVRWRHCPGRPATCGSNATRRAAPRYSSPPGRWSSPSPPTPSSPGSRG